MVTREIEASVEIDAPAERVWHVLSDTPRYGEWNRFVPLVQGELQSGGTLRVRVCPHQAPTLFFKATLIHVEPPFEFRWVGRLADAHVLGWPLLPPLFEGEHAFRIEPLSESRVRMVQHETQWGLLLPLLGRWIHSWSVPGFDEMNQALKRRVEGKEA
jgi:hypothetical protein